MNTAKRNEQADTRKMNSNHIMGGIRMKKYFALCLGITLGLLAIHVQAGGAKAVMKVVEETVEACHHLTGNLVQSCTSHAEEILRTVDLQVFEERRFQRRIILTPGIDKIALRLLTLVSRLASSVYLPYKRRHLNKIRSCTRNNTNSFCHKNLNFVQRYVFFPKYLDYLKKICTFAPRNTGRAA